MHKQIRDDQSCKEVEIVSKTKYKRKTEQTLLASKDLASGGLIVEEKMSSVKISIKEAK